MKTTPTFVLITILLITGCSSNGPSGKEQVATFIVANDASPKHFWFDYPYQPAPGKRYWTRTDSHTWIEQYESGDYSRFKVKECATVDGVSGTIVVKITGDPQATETSNDGTFQAFVPDGGSKEMQFRFRRMRNGQWNAWSSLAEMKGIE